MQDNKQPKSKSMIFYIYLTLFCIVFAGIYEFFSHQVYSKYMIGSFLFPLIGGVIPMFFIDKRNNTIKPYLFSELSYSFGIITFMIGSIFQGILEIYGTTNGLISVYWYAGTTLVTIGVLSWIYQFISQKMMRPQKKVISASIVLVTLFITLGLIFYTRSQNSTDVATNQTDTTTHTDTTDTTTINSDEDDETNKETESDDTDTQEKSTTHSHSNSDNKSESKPSGSQSKNHKH